MKNVLKSVITFLIFYWTSLAWGQAINAPEAYVPSSLKVSAPDVSIEPSVRIRGKGFDWDDEIQVALPPSYRKSAKAYPVLWVTDGLINFDFAVEIVNGPMKKYWPEMIVVGIGGPSELFTEFQVRRTYEFSPIFTSNWGFRGVGGDDLAKRALESAGLTPASQASFRTGGAPKFLDFLVDELRPILGKKYRMSGGHVLFGSSAGGQFCTYALLARPRSFEKYICLSPNLNSNDYELFRQEDKYAKANKDLHAAVYFAAGEGEILQGGIISGLGIVSSMSRMAEILTLRQYASLKLWAHIFPGEEHGSFKPLGLARGLRAMWTDDADGTRNH